MKEKKDYKEYMKNWYVQNIEKRKEYQKAYYTLKKNTTPKYKKVESVTGKIYYIPVKFKKKRKKQNINKLRENRKLKKYNLSKKEYNKIFNEQKGCCAICNKHQSEFKRKLHIDHCHKTGKVRGLLCFSCNVGIGYLKDDVEILLNAVKYLR